MNIIKKEKITPPAIGIISCIILVTFGEIFNYKISFGIIVIVLFLNIYIININQSYLIFLSLIPLIPIYLAIDLGPKVPLISAYRILYILFIIDELIIKKKTNKLINCIVNNKFTKVILGFVICIITSTMFNFNSTSIINCVSIIVEQVLLFYIIYMNLDNKEKVEHVIDIFIAISLILSIVGVFEYLTSFNIFTLLDTSNRVVASHYVRMGNLRVSTSFKHSLGYGLYLVLFTPLVMYRINTLKSNKPSGKYLFYFVTLIFMNINILLTSSRSTLIILALQYIIMFIMLGWKEKIKKIIIGFIILTPIIVIISSPIANKLPIISTLSNSLNSIKGLVIDDLESENFGDNSEPFTYRLELINYALSQKGRNLIVGEGLGFIRDNPLVFNIPELNPWEPIVSYSVDNYYVLKFLELGLLGVLPIIIIIFKFMKVMFLDGKNHILSKFILISITGYCIHLIMVDELETIKYMWIILAIFCSNLKINQKEI